MSELNSLSSPFQNSYTLYTPISVNPSSLPTFSSHQVLMCFRHHSHTATTSAVWTNRFTVTVSSSSL